MTALAAVPAMTIPADAHPAPVAPLTRGVELREGSLRRDLQGGSAASGEFPPSVRDLLVKFLSTAAREPVFDVGVAASDPFGDGREDYFTGNDYY